MGSNLTKGVKTWVQGRAIPFWQPLTAEQPTEVTSGLHQGQLHDGHTTQPLPQTVPQADIGAALQEAVRWMAASQEQTLT